jgi:hypothetical protein
VSRRPSDVDVRIARHVVHFFGDTNLGEPGGPAVNALIRLIIAALVDHSSTGEQVLAGLYAQWPQYVAAVRHGSPESGSWGFEWLRGIVKNDDQLTPSEWVHA